MIDEELYKIATDELNSDDRNPAVWARACALASDDHDEARFLYTNLRVEEMLNKDGKQRTFSTTRQPEQPDLNKSDELDSLELSLENDDTLPVSSKTGVSSGVSTPLPIDDLISYDENAISSPSSVAGNAQESNSNDTFDSESLAEIEALAQNNNSTEGSLSTLTGKTIDQSPNSAQADQTDFLLSDDLVQGKIIDASPPSTPTIPAMLAPESQRTALLSENLERQAQDMNDPEADSDVHLHSKPYSNAEEVTQHDSIRTDYADTHILDDDVMLHDDSSLDTGIGRAFMVFSRGSKLKAIKRGASWPALFFTFPWLISKALFGTALVYGCLWVVSLAGLFVTTSLWMNASPDATMIIKLWTLGFALLAIIGLLYIPFQFGNSWVAKKLQNKGFEFESAVSAGNKQEAIARLINQTD